MAVLIALADSPLRPRQLRAAGVPAKVVFLTMHHEVAYARRALTARQARPELGES